MSNHPNTFTYRGKQYIFNLEDPVVLKILEEMEWECLVTHEKRDILVDPKIHHDPIQILMKIFDLCIDGFDNIPLEEKHTDLYQCLLTLYHANNEKPLIDSLEENTPNILRLIKIFSREKEEIKRIDSALYYALLGFMDFLKTSKGKHLYYRVIF